MKNKLIRKRYRIFKKLDRFYKWAYVNYIGEYKTTVLILGLLISSVLLYIGSVRYAVYLLVFSIFSIVVGSEYMKNLFVRTNKYNTSLINKKWPDTLIFLVLEVMVNVFFFISLICLFIFICFHITTMEYDAMSGCVEELPKKIIRASGFLFTIFFTLSEISYILGSLHIIILEKEIKENIKIKNIFILWSKLIIYTIINIFLLHGFSSFYGILEPTILGNVFQNVFGTGYGYETVHDLICDRFLRQTSVYASADYVETRGVLKMVNSGKLKEFMKEHEEEIFIELGIDKTLLIGLDPFKYRKSN